MHFARFLLPVVALAGLAALVAIPQACSPCHGSCGFSRPTWDSTTCSCTGGFDAGEFPVPDATMPDSSVDAGSSDAAVTDASE